jgi:uncharacterized protein (TIGR03435 family)
MRLFAFATVAALTADVLSLGAAGQAQAPAFDVASVRPNISGGDTSFRALPNGRLTATNIPVRTLILRAYGLHDSQLIDAPPWTAVDRFDIVAQAEQAPASGPDALLPMLRTLLVDRFRLRVRAETRELPAYVLALATGDRRLGEQLRPTQADCTKAKVMTKAELSAVAKEGWPPCGQTVTISFVTSFSDGSRGSSIRVRRSAITMKDFATMLQGSAGRPVVDRTGLEGMFDVEYTFASQPPAVSTELAAGANVPPLFVALEEQLGLKLESERTEVPVLVIESVERPTEN